MSDQAIAQQIPVHERAEAIALIHDGGRCYGAIVRNLVTGELASLRRQGHRDRRRRRGTALPRDHQCGDLRRHSHRHRARDRRRHARQHGGGAVSSDAGLSCRNPAHRGRPRRRRAAEGRRRPSLHARLRAGEKGAGLARRGLAPHGRAHRQRQGREVALRRPPVAGHHAPGRAPHQAQPARGLRDLPLFPRRRSGQGVGAGAAGAALHDGRRAHQPHRRKPDAEGTVFGRRGGLLGHAWLQPAGRQLGGRDGGGRHDRRRVHRRLLRAVRERRRVSPPVWLQETLAARASEARCLDRRPRHGERRCDHGRDADDHDRQGRHLSQRPGVGRGGGRAAAASCCAAATSACATRRAAPIRSW